LPFQPLEFQEFVPAISLLQTFPDLCIGPKERSDVIRIQNSHTVVDTLMKNLVSSKITGKLVKIISCLLENIQMQKNM